MRYLGYVYNVIGMLGSDICASRCYDCVDI